jgi:hypothetical protein
LRRGLRELAQQEGDTILSKSILTRELWKVLRELGSRVEGTAVKTGGNGSKQQGKAKAKGGNKKGSSVKAVDISSLLQVGTIPAFSLFAEWRLTDTMFVFKPTLARLRWSVDSVLNSKGSLNKTPTNSF